MERIAFKMKVFPGQEQEYKRRHDTIWPELARLLKHAGVSEYSIFLDEETNTLFGFLKSADKQAFDQLPLHPVMRKWWDYMQDIMETQPDHAPVSIPLREVFYLE